MKFYLTTVILQLIFQSAIFSQATYPVPINYKIFKNFDDSSYRLTDDLDGDGTADLVTVYAKNNSDNDNVVAIYLSTISNKTPYQFPFSALSYNIAVKNKVLIIGSCFGNGRYCKELKLKYYPALKNMRLIGYDEESFGNALHEGAYYKSVNLLTNRYEVSGPKWKTKVAKQHQFPTITLDKLDEESLDYLEQIGEAIINK